MEAGQLNVNDPVILGDKVWWVATKGDHGDVALSRDDGGGCVTVCHLGEHEEVERATDVLEAARRRFLSAMDRARRSRRFSVAWEMAVNDEGEAHRLVSWLEAQGVGR